ncbi:hypothetical protein F5X96DRAFT_671422 [Biscogniauxia mediterranea]|nr:hypothetical protein F5X96DRAFT_671422 [Biscogniauxia mediterranea]
MPGGIGPDPWDPPPAELVLLLCHVAATTALSVSIAHATWSLGSLRVVTITDGYSMTYIGVWAVANYRSPYSLLTPVLQIKKKGDLHGGLRASFIRTVSEICPSRDGPRSMGSSGCLNRTEIWGSRRFSFVDLWAIFLASSSDTTSYALAREPDSDE